MPWRDFERKAATVMSREFGVELTKRNFPHPKKFDLISEDGRIVGDAKYLSLVRGRYFPSAKMMEISGHIWMLEKVRATTKFLVFGNQINVPQLWIEKYGRFNRNVKFYFINSRGELSELN